MTKSNKARERYLLVTGSELKGLYQDARQPGKSKVIDLGKRSKADNGKG